MPTTRSDIDDGAGPSGSLTTLLPGLKTAVATLFPVGASPVANTAAWQAAAWWFVPLGLLTGLVWAGAFRVSWWAFGEVGGLCPIPALAVVVLDVVFLGAREYWGVSRVFEMGKANATSSGSEDDRRPFASLIAIVITVLAMWVLIVALPKGPGYWPSDWRHTWHLNELYPRPVFRPLILAPIWGRWAMLMAGNVGRARPGSSATTFCAVARPVVVLVNVIPVLAITTIYCSRRGNRLLGLIVALVVLTVSHVLSTVMGRRCRGQCFETLLAVAKAAELTFLLTYLALVART